MVMVRGGSVCKNRRPIGGFKDSSGAVDTTRSQAEAAANERHRDIASARIDGDPIRPLHRVIAIPDFPIGGGFHSSPIRGKTEDAVGRVGVVSYQLNRVNPIAAVNGDVVGGQVQASAPGA